jgi:hypothetical protein
MIQIPPPYIASLEWIASADSRPNVLQAIDGKNWKGKDWDTQDLIRIEANKFS